MQQRALIAKALASEPALLALDEPTTGVDAESQESLGALLEQLRSELGVTILYVSHEFGAVEASSSVSCSSAARSSSTGSPAAYPGCGTTRHTAMLDLEFMRLASAMGAVVGLLAPAVGFFLVSGGFLIGDGIGHVAFAGVAAGYLLGHLPCSHCARGRRHRRPRDRVAPDAGRRRGRPGIGARLLHRDRRGVVLVSSAGALNVNLFQFLFGSILTVTRNDLWPCRARRGRARHDRAALPRPRRDGWTRREAVSPGCLSTRLNVVVAVLAALTVAVSMRIVGILLIAALMVLPVIAANRVAWSLRSTSACPWGSGSAPCSPASRSRTTRTFHPAGRSCSSRRARSCSARAAAQLRGASDRR